MFAELWSLATLPFENLTTAISLITFTLAIPTLLNLYRQEQGKKQMLRTLPELDIAAEYLIDEKEQNLAKMLQALKQHPKLKNAWLLPSSEQLPFVAMLLIASLAIGQLHKTQARSCEFQADQAVRLLDQDPKELISALEKIDEIQALTLSLSI